MTFFFLSVCGYRRGSTSITVEGPSSNGGSLEVLCSWTSVVKVQMLVVVVGFTITCVDERTSFFLRFLSFFEIEKVGCWADLSSLTASVMGGGVVDIRRSQFFSVKTFHTFKGGRSVVFPVVVDILGPGGGVMPGCLVVVVDICVSTIPAWAPPYWIPPSWITVLSSPFTIEAGIGSNLTQPSSISYFSLYTFFSDVLASVMILNRNSLLKVV